MSEILKHAYRAILTGAPNGETDLPLKPTSLNLTLNSGTSYASISIVASPDIIDAVSARIDGYIIVYRTIHYADGGQDAEETILNAPFEDFDYDEGSKRFSATLKARGVFTNAVPATVTTTRLISTSRNASGEMVFNTGHSTAALPGDTFDHGGTGYLIKQVRITVSEQGLTQELTEQL